MKHLLVIIGMLLVTAGVQGQAVEVKGNQIVIDGKEQATIEKQGCGIKPDCTYYIRDAKGKTLITIIAMDFNDPSAKTNINEDGLVRYLRFSFSDGKGIAEVPNPALLALKPKDVAQIIAKANLIKDGELNAEEVQNFVQAHGTSYSDRKKEVSKQIIIIQKE